MKKAKMAQKRLKRLRRSSVSCLLAFGATSAVSAQTGPPSTAPGEVQSKAGVDRSLEEIVVTATRRPTSVVEVPYNISVYTGTELATQNIDTFSKLVQSVPGVDFADTGAKYSRTAGQFLVLRGLNGTGSARGGGSGYGAQGQPPVATYYGDTPTFAYFPIRDINDVEVLRGPQGTLFGAGALAGAIRIMPNAPKLGETSGEVTASGASVSHAGSNDYTVDGILNLPIGNYAALRALLGQEYQAGFIDGLGLFEKTSPNPLAPAVQTGNLASPPMLAPQKGINDQLSTYGRVALRIEPSDAWRFTFAYNWDHLNGGDANADNPSWPGGAYNTINPPLPGVLLPPTGPHEQVLSSLQPWNQNTHIASLDVAVDVGFATVSLDSSYYDSHGTNWTSSEAVDGRGYGYYYQGQPRYPGWFGLYSFENGDHGATEEIRLVSTKGRKVDYIVGAYYSRTASNTDWNIYSPNGPAWKTFSGSPYPWGFIQGDQITSLTRAATNTELAGFGEVTYHLTDLWQATAGARAFRTTSDTAQAIAALAFTGGIVSDGENTNSYNGHLFKVNTSYEFSHDHRVYATWSQGFRHGGANAFPFTGALAEPPALVPYKPDFVSNWEAGIKGRFPGGVTYAAAAFYDRLKDVQIDTQTPSLGWPVVVNGGTARSQGVELELSGKIMSHLRANLGFTYTDAKLIDSFAVHTQYGVISGEQGTRLPQSSKIGAGGSLTYDMSISPNTTLSWTASANYKSSVVFDVPRTDQPVPYSAGGYTLFNANAELAHGPWSATAFIDNLSNKRAVTAQFVGDYIDNRANGYFINPPRKIGLRIAYKF